MAFLLGPPPAGVLLASVFNDGLGTREGQLYFTLMGLMLVPTVVAFFAFYGLAALRNLNREKTPWSKRLAGTVGVLAFAAFATWFAWERAVDHAYLRALPLPGKIEHLVTILAVPGVPALLVLAVVGARAIVTAEPTGGPRQR